jgi:hypothetical protein
MTDAQAALAQVSEALEAMRGDWLGDGFTKLRRQLAELRIAYNAACDALRS